ncbi:MAG: hypothetical protein LBG87_06545 [Spirochaetaceae bacterium]|jgi:hypothetical protein|nr:hypothetical protein [Spirochaetaceae bacterium]
MKKNEKNILLAIAGWFVFSAVSCSDFSVPESITVKGDPGLYVPMGRFSEIEGGKADIGKLVSKEEIAKMTGGEKDGVKLYDYPDSDSDALTYLIRFQIANMPKDLSKYMKTDITIPSITLAGQGELPQPISVGLGDMNDLIESVTLDPSGIRIAIPDDAVKNNLQIYIPAMHFDDYKFGELGSGENAGYWCFFGDSGELHPQQDKKIDIFVKLIDTITPTTIAPEFVLNWTEAVVDTSSEAMEDTYPLDMSGLMEGLGPGITFKQVKGYMYIDGIETGMIGLKIGAEDVLGGEKDITGRPSPEFDPAGDTFTGELPEDSIDGDECINMKPAFEKEAKGVTYAIRINTMTITPENAVGHITADMVIELPLEFKVEGALRNIEGTLYVKLDLGDGILPKGDGNDLFGRSPDAENDILDKIHAVTVYVKDIKNTAFPVSISVAVGGKTEVIDLSPNNGAIANQDILFEDPGNPFSPAFEVLLPTDEGADSGTLTILPSKEPTFDFFLAVSAKIGIDKTF